MLERRIIQGDVDPKFVEYGMISTPAAESIVNRDRDITEDIAYVLK